MKKTHYLSTGEFARLCRTTKETLFHYDREGILKPKHVSENGYRRYGPEQFFDFDMIATLKETGSPLKEIRRYLHAGSEELLNLLEARRDIVRAERARLAEREAMLSDVARLAREALHTSYDAVLFEDQGEEFLDVLAIEPASVASDQDEIERYAEFYEFYEQQGQAPRYPFGTLVAFEDVRQGRFVERYFFSRANALTPAERQHRKPGGRYAVLLHKGADSGHRLAWQGLLRHIADAGLRVVGDAYAYDMASYIVAGSGEEYVIKYCVPVSG